MISRRIVDTGFRRLIPTALSLLLACIAFSVPANATTFTLAELQKETCTVCDFTIGNLQFFDFDTTRTSVGPDLITIETVDSEFVPGFVVNGNGQWMVMGDLDGSAIEIPPFLDFSYSIRTVDEQPLIGGAVLWANDYSIENGTRLDLTLADGGSVDLDVIIIEPFGLPITNNDLPSDSVNLLPRVNSLVLDSSMQLDIVGDLGPQGPAMLNSYAMLHPVVVPEPGTALLMGLGLTGLGVVGRSQRRATHETA